MDQAIKSGEAYLRSLQNDDGSWKADPLPERSAAITALVGLTLLECDIGKSDPAVQKAAAYVRGVEAGPVKLSATYDLATAILFFDRLATDGGQDSDLIRRLALRLVGGQTPSRRWNYLCPVFSDADSLVLYNLWRRARPTSPPI